MTYTHHTHPLEDPNVRRADDWILAGWGESRVREYPQKCLNDQNLGIYPAYMFR